MHTFTRNIHSSYSREPDAKIAVLSMTEDPNTSVACQFPFSWVLKAALDEIWETVHQAKGDFRLSATIETNYRRIIFVSLFYSGLCQGGSGLIE